MERKEFLITSALASISYSLLGQVTRCKKRRYSQYFDGWEVKPEFKMEFVSLWPGWLGKENCHKLDEVTVDEWAQFNTLTRLIAKKYNIELVDCEAETILKIDDIENTLSNYEESMNKEYSMFSR